MSNDKIQIEKQIIEKIDCKLADLKEKKAEYDKNGSYKDITRLVLVGSIASLTLIPALGILLTGNPLSLTIEGINGPVNLFTLISISLAPIVIPAAFYINKKEYEKCKKIEKEKNGVINQIKYLEEQKEKEINNLKKLTNNSDKKENSKTLKDEAFKRMALLEKSEEEAYNEGYNAKCELEEKGPVLVKRKKENYIK
jgi:hypothetical protein